MSKKQSTKTSEAHEFLKSINPKKRGRPKKHTPDDLGTAKVIVITGMSPGDKMIYTLKYADHTIRTYQYGALDPRVIWGAKEYPPLACDVQELADIYASPDSLGQKALGHTVCCIPLAFAKELLPDVRFAPLA